jgi:CRP-like cAMP-binding protein
LKTIKKHPFLKGLSAEHLARLAECAMFAHFDADQLIFQEGDVANRFYLITDGAINLETIGAEGGAVIVQALGKGDVLGWSWLFPPYYWRFGARAAKPTEAVFFYGTRLREWCEEDHDFGYELMKRVSEVIIKRLQVTRGQLIEVEEKA